MSKAERSLFGVLCEALKDRYYIFAKVRLSDLLLVPKGTEGWQGLFNKIQSKHVDFVICDRTLVRPLLCVELDDSSHSQSRRQIRDGFLDAALLAAGLPIIHVPAKRAYNMTELRQTIEAAIAAS